MSGGSALNLSLLSRGIGEVSRNGHEKVEVVFEPEDYFNWANNPERMLRLPAIPQQQRQAFSKTLEKHFDYAKAENLAYVHVPKTFTTRKGALLLFSEDLATKTTPRNMQDRKQHLVTHSMDDFDLRTVDDLAKSILSYGKDENADGMYLGFVHPRRWYRETRRIRPGFSAKRYLSTWTQSWDDTLLHKLLDKGYMTEGSIQQVSFIPNKRVRLYDDLSNCPAPYRLLRTMLLSPGSLSGYMFYRIRPQSEQSMSSEKEDQSGARREEGQSKPIVHMPQTESLGKIKVVQSKHGVLSEVQYNELERNKQEEVLTELLVKSAIHHALQKQQEYMEESFPEDVLTRRSQVSNAEGSSLSREEGREKTPLPDFDMKEAVESLLDSKKGTSLLDGSLLSAKAPKGRPYSDEVPPDGHFPRSFDTSSIGSNRSGKLLQQQQASQQLPPIIDEGGDISSPYTVLPPIQDARVPVEKEDGKMDVPLVNIEPPTPQHSTLTNLPQSVRGGPSREPTIPPTEESTHEDDEGAEWGVDITETEILERAREASMIRRESERELAGSGAQGGEKVQHSPRSKGPVLAAGSHLHSSRESLAESSTGSQVHLPGTLPSWKGSQPSLKSGGGTHSKKGGSTKKKTEE